jgi:hypothetical protein
MATAELTRPMIDYADVVVQPGFINRCTDEELLATRVLLENYSDPAELFRRFAAKPAACAMIIQFARCAVETAQRIRAISETTKG